MPRPFHHGRHTVSALPVGVFLTAKRCHARIWPSVHVWTIVGRIHNDCVVTHTKVVQYFENLSNILIVVDHCIVIWALPMARLSNTLSLCMSANMHMGKIYPYESRLAGRILSLYKFNGPVCNLVINCFHPLLGQWTGIFDGLHPNFTETGIYGRILFISSLAIKYIPWAKLGKKRRVFWIIRMFWFFRSVQMVECSKELIESVNGGEVFIPVTKVIFTELSGGLSLAF